MELIYPEFYDRFSLFLRELEGRKIVVIAHSRPDGDCIGSQVALARVLRALDLDVICANPDPVPRRRKRDAGGAGQSRARPHQHRTDRRVAA